jgi:hypothetical protein
MSLLRNIATGLRSLFRREQVDRESNEELGTYLEMAAAEKMKQGMSRQEALRIVRLERGSPETTKEIVRAGSWETLVEACWQDLRFGQRMLRKTPGFTTVAVLTLALGIGANAAIFSYIDAWFIKPLPYPKPDRLVIFETQDKKHGWTNGGVTSTADFFDFQKQSTSFEQTVAWGGASLNLTGDGLPELVDGGRVSWNFFDTLGAKPILGRTFTAEDDRSGAPHVAILSQGLWQGRYAGDPQIIGRKIAIGGEAYTVVGVMPGLFNCRLWASPICGRPLR